MKARRRLGVVVAVALAVIALAGCGGVVGSLVSTQEDIRNAGYGSVKVGLTDGDASLSVSASTASAPTASNVNEVGGIVWHEFHQRFGYVAVTLHGAGRTRRDQLSFTQLQGEFGPRNPAYNRTSLRSALVHVGVVAIIVIVVVGIAVTVLVVLLVRRSRRRRRPPPGYGPWGPGSGPGGPGSAGAGAAGPGSWGPGAGGPGSWAPGGQSGPPASPGGPGSWGERPPAGPGAPPPIDPWGRPLPGESSRRAEAALVVG